MTEDKFKTLKIICGDCKKEFELNVRVKKSRFQKMRKYCDKCKKERTEAWKNKDLIEFEDCEDE